MAEEEALVYTAVISGRRLEHAAHLSPKGAIVSRYDAVDSALRDLGLTAEQRRVHVENMGDIKHWKKQDALYVFHLSHMDGDLFQGGNQGFHRNTFSLWGNEEEISHVVNDLHTLFNRWNYREAVVPVVGTKNVGVEQYLNEHIKE